MNVPISSAWFDKISSSDFVGKFPVRIQMIFGGNPNKAFRSLKSES